MSRLPEAHMNIGGDKSDASFRYKMPSLQIKPEGRGNGVKTILLNLTEVAKALFLAPDYIAKFFSLELGCSYRVADQRYVLNGSHSLTLLHSHLEKFIQQFVLCPRCGLPEWSLRVSKETVLGQCSACGHHAPLKSQHKLVGYLVKHPPTGKTTVTATATATRMVSEKQDSKQEEEDDNWGEDASKEAQQKRYEEEMKAHEVSAPSTKGDLRSLIQEGRPVSQIMSELRRLELAHQYTDAERIRALLHVLLDVTSPKKLVHSLQRHADLLRRVISTPLLVPLLMGEVEKILASNPSLTPFALQTLYEMDLFGEEFLICWYESPPETSFQISRPQAVEIRRHATGFMEWLRSAEEESDEE